MVAPALVWPGFDPDRAGLGRRARRRLARGTRHALGAGDALGLAAALLEIDAPAAGPLARLAEGGEADARVWYCAEPVLLVADRDRVRVLGLGDEAPTEAEAAALAAAACAHFAAEDLRIERRGRWYVSAAAFTGTPAEFAGDVPVGGGALVRMLTELQMLWYAHPVNEARRHANRPPVNGLRLWGGGRLAGTPARPALRRRLLTDAPEVVGLARWLGLEQAPLAAPSAEAAPAATVIAADAANDAHAARWLEYFLARRQGFELLVREARIAVPRRRFPLPARLLR